MIRSMTGFTSCSKLLTINNQKIPLTINIKSLNSRYFDFNARIPYPLSNLETDFMRLCKSMLYRGSIIFSIHAANPQAFKGPIEPSTNTIKNYLKALEAIQKECAIQGSLSLSDVIMLPNIFSTEEIDIDDTTKQELFDLAHKALDQLIQAQTAEGKALLEDILNRLEIVNQEIEKIEKAFTAILQAQKEKVNSALSLLESDTSKFAEAQKDALFALLDKIDIHEEIIRFKNHLKTLQENLESAHIEKGKRIDFIVQELSREINTITAKCADSVISKHAINIKVELEKIREQSQNIV